MLTKIQINYLMAYKKKLIPVNYKELNFITDIRSNIVFRVGEEDLATLTALGATFEESRDITSRFNIDDYIITEEFEELENSFILRGIVNDYIHEVQVLKHDLQLFPLVIKTALNYKKKLTPVFIIQNDNLIGMITPLKD